MGFTCGVPPATMIGMGDDDGYVDDDTWQFVQTEAEKHHDGNWGKAAAAILKAAREAEQNPHDSWAGLDARIRGRRQ
jgi:hypothetical protein